MKRSTKKVFLLIPTLLACMNIFAEYNTFGIPDSTEIRKQLIDSYFNCKTEELENKTDTIYTNDIGQKFQVSVEKSDEEYQICIVPERTVEMKKYGNQNVETVSIYDKTEKGSWILFRNADSGNAEKIRIYLNSADDVFLEFHSEGTKTLADMIIEGDVASLSVPMGIRFQRLYSSSFQEIMNWTKNSLPWNYVLIYKDQYNDSLVMINEITKMQKVVENTPYACYNQENQLCSYLTGKKLELTDEKGNVVEPVKGRKYLSDAGFLKWIIDSITGVYTDSIIPIEDLTESTVVFDETGKNGVLSKSYSLTFSLDWCRNLAYICHESKSTALYGIDKNQVDVNYNYFICHYSDKKTVSPYYKDTGYEIRNLKSLLYVLAATEPSNFYLCAVKQHSSLRPDEFVFADCVAIFPYFDSEGNFNYKILKGNTEISLEEFADLYRNSFVHLERVKCSKYLLFQ